MLEDFRLRVFMAVAQEGSFTKAAVSLGVTQPAVSQNIAELEKITGVRLFERLRGVTVLTAEGRVFGDYARRLLATCASAENMFAKLSAANVRICASEEVYNHFIAPSLEAFVKVHPEVVFERVLFDDADLVVALRPCGASPFDIPAESIARIRMSLFPIPTTGDLMATREKTSYFDVIYKPSPAFACTRLCRLLQEYLTSF